MTGSTRRVIEYAQAMSQTSPNVTDELFAGLPPSPTRSADIVSMS